MGIGYSCKVPRNPGQDASWDWSFPSKQWGSYANLPGSQRVPIHDLCSKGMHALSCHHTIWCTSRHYKRWYVCTLLICISMDSWSLASTLVTWNGYYIPQGSTLLSNMYTMHRSDTVYDNANEFIPERFLDNTNTMLAASNGRLQNRDHYNFGWGR